MSQPPMPPQRNPGSQPPSGQAPQYQQPIAPPPVYQAKAPIPTKKEESERQRILLYSFITLLGILVVGVAAGFIDSAVRNRDNYFILNAEDILLVIASIAPWAVLFLLIAMVWVFVANRLFIKWNSALASNENDEAYGKGIIYEIVRDNNAAAALILIMPLVVIALVLIFIVILIKTV